MSEQEEDLEDLEKRIKEHKRLLRRIVSFVRNIVLERGVRLSRSHDTWHIHTISELKFENFEFGTDLGQTSMGGNEVTIKYASQGQKELVFRAYWQIARFDPSDLDAFVAIFAREHRWLPELEELMKSRSSIISRIDRERKLEGKKRLNVTLHDQHKAELEDEVQRLKL